MKSQPLEFVQVAVAIPCLNEEKTIAQVIENFRRELPGAKICVIDNHSTDNTAGIAEKNGAEVIYEPRQGKGFAVETIFRCIPEPYIVMVDGDDTYPAAEVKNLLMPLVEGRADMVIGSRLNSRNQNAFRKYHTWGNVFLTKLFNMVFHSDLTDILSGYRAFSRKVVEQVPINTGGFDVETELTLQSLYCNLAILEVPISFQNRPQGSHSKLRTFRDGFRILWKIFKLLMAFKPLSFWGGLGIMFVVLGFLSGITPIRDYLTHPRHYISHVPLTILAGSLCVIGMQFVFVGILLHVICERFRHIHNIITRKK